MDIQSAIRKRTPYSHDDIPFVLAWAQKSGCTSILKWFLFHAGLLEEAEAYVTGMDNIDIHVYENSVLKSSPGYKQKLARRLADGITVINFIRCPYSRSFSSYLHLNKRWYIGQDRNSRQSPGLELRRSILRAVYGEDVSIEYTFSFLDYLSWIRQQDPESLELHHAPQFSEIYHHDNIRHYRLEQLTQMIPLLESEFQLQASQSMAEKFTGKHHKEKSDVSRAATLKFLETGMPINPSPTFKFPRVTREILAGSEAAALIEEIFHRDLQVYDSLAQ